MEGVFEERVELVHFELAPLKYAEAVLERFVDVVAEFAHLDADEILLEHSKVEAVRLLCQHGAPCPPPSQAEYHSSWPRSQCDLPKIELFISL